MEIKDNEVYTFKLVSGEEIVTKVLGSDTDYIYITEPLAVGPGQQGPVLMQGLFTSVPGAKVSLNIKHIAMIADTEDGIRQRYIKVTTGIDVPSKKLILG
jgi:hypothetical protein